MKVGAMISNTTGQPFLVCGLALFALAIVSSVAAADESGPRIQEYPVPAGSRPHGVAPATDGTVWYTAHGLGETGRLDPAPGQTKRVKRGDRSRPTGASL